MVVSVFRRAAGVALLLVASTLLLAEPLLAQSVTPVGDYSRLIASGGNVKALGTDLFGDTVDLYSGRLDIRQTDVDIPGNNALPVQVTRRFIYADAHDWAKGQFGDWELEIPRISGIFSTYGGWTLSLTGDDAYKRCSRFGPPPGMAGTGGGYFPPHEYWMGTWLELGGSREELLERYPTTPAPTDGNAWPAVTQSGTVLRCLSTLASTSQSGSRGEGFVAVTPDGTQYFFDHMVVRPFVNLQKTDPVGSVGPLSTGGGTTGLSSSSNQTTSGSGQFVIAAAEDYLLYRSVFTLYPSKAVDRYGNTLQYTWNPQAPAQLLQVRASDGRSLTFQYLNSTDKGIRSVSDGRRTWTYQYKTGLSGVTLPDGTAWSMDLYGLSSLNVTQQSGDCDAYGAVTGAVGTGSMTHPNGAQVSFTTAGRKLGRTWVPRSCWGGVNTGTGLYAEMPRVTGAAAVVERRITGSGLPAGGYVWKYAYGESEGCWDPVGVPSIVPASVPRCTAATDATRTVTVTRPEGWQDRYVFGTWFQKNEGMLLRMEQAVQGGTAQRAEWRTYAEPTQGPYPTSIGRSYQHRSDGHMGAVHQPLKERLLQVGQDVFEWKVDAFDTRARPLKVVRSSENESVTEQYAWFDDTQRWVLGQVASLRDMGSGVYMQQTTFDTASRPEHLSVNGRRVESRRYNADGTLSGRADGAGNWTDFASWYRGVPRSVVNADATKRSAEVSAEGWVTSTKDEPGYVTRYTYDDLGRLTGITPPASTPLRNPVIRGFTKVAAGTSGLGADYWAQTETQGNRSRTVWFDALLRPWREQEADTTLAASTHIVQRNFDSAGNVTFESVPAASASTVGIRTTFDGLGRVTQLRQDSELGVLATTHEYLPGARVRITDPRGKATTTTYRFLDSPSYDEPTLVDAPEGARTRIVRNAMGKPVRIERESY